MIYNIVYLKRIPLAFTLHTRDVVEPERRLFLFLTKWMRKSDIIFSENTKKWYLKNNSVIPNGVDFNSFSASNNPECLKSEIFSFLYLGRLSAEKNPLQLIQCALDLREKGIKERLRKRTSHCLSFGINSPMFRTSSLRSCETTGLFFRKTSLFSGAFPMFVPSLSR